MPGANAGHFFLENISSSLELRDYVRVSPRWQKEVFIPLLQYKEALYPKI
jgi:hypothetical protein